MKMPRLLLVDDEIPFTANLEKLLSRRGYEVTVANDGTHALRLVQEQEFDVVILDQKMPGLDGISTLQELKKKDLGVEVLILTGHGSVESGIKGLQFGAYDYVRKPIRLSDLEERITQAFDRKLLRESKEISQQRNMT
jgi:DNA-binding response OmpR family regulator